MDRILENDCWPPGHLVNPLNPIQLFSLSGDCTSIGRWILIGQSLEARKLTELNETVLQLVRRILNPFTKATLRISQLFLGEQDFRKTNY